MRILPAPDAWTAMVRFGERGRLLPATLPNVAAGLAGRGQIEVHFSHGASGCELIVRDGSDLVAWIPFIEGGDTPEAIYAWALDLGQSAILQAGSAWCLEHLRLAGGAMPAAGPVRVTTLNPGGRAPAMKPAAPSPQMELF